MSRVQIPTPLRWADMDAFGHVNNVMFLRLIEEARVAVFTQPVDNDKGTLLDTGVLVVRNEIDYMVPMPYRPEPIIIEMWCTQIGGASFDLQYRFLDGPERDPVVEYAQAETSLVLFDLQTQRPRRLRDSERAVMESWQDDPIELRGMRKKMRRAAADRAAAS